MGLKPARLGSAVAVGLLIAGVFATPALAAGTGTVQGAFTTSTGTPITGATVTAYSGDGEWLTDTTTTSTGRYTLRGVAAGGVQLQFDNAGLQHWAPGVFDQGDATTYTLAAGATLTVDEHQPATGTIAGHFTDAAGAPAYASVSVPGTSSSFTDDQGAYALDLFPGTYKVRFQWDAAQQWAVQATSEEAATTYQVTAGQTTTVDDHKLPVGSIGGTITRTDGSPLANAQVTLHRGGESVGFAGTFDEGVYSFGEALAGDGYTVSYSSDGGPDVYVPGTLDPAKATRFSVATGQTTTVDDTQPAPAAVHGKLTGAPTAGMQVSVSLASNDNWFQLSGETAADGTWSVPGLFPGDYKVSFTTPDYQRTQWAYGKGTETDADLISVAAGADVAVDDSWLPGATLVVKAIDAGTGAPVTNYCVWVTTPGDGTGCATTGNQVTVSDLPGGSFKMQVSPGEDSYYLSSAYLPVTLTPGQTTTVRVKLTLGGKVAFSAADHATGAPVDRTCAALVVLGHGGLPDGYGDCTDATGKATSQHIAAGTYELYAIAPTGYGDQWVGAAGGTGDQKAAARIQVKPGKTVTAPAALLDKAATITGVVTDAAGAPLSGMDVAWSAWGDAGPAWDSETDANGRYTIDQLGPYGWPLLFGGKGYPRQWSGHVGNRFQAAPASGTYNFTPVAGAALKGKVTAPAGSQWRIHAYNAATGDQMGSFDVSAAGPGGTYLMPVIGSQQVKIGYYWSVGDTNHDGWYKNASGIDTATKVPVPATGTKTLNLKIG